MDILIRRLEEQKPTAIQFFPGDFLLFGPDGVKYYPDSGLYVHMIPPDAWALSDSTRGLPQPSVALEFSAAKVILASSPAETRWKEWKKQTCAGVYVMDIWNNGELGALVCVSPRESSSTQLTSS